MFDNIQAPVDPFIDFPKNLRDVEGSNCSITVKSVSPVVSGKSEWKGIIVECEVTFTDGPAAGHTQETKAIQTLQNKDGTPVTKEDARRDAARLTQLLGALYEVKGYPLAENATGFLTPGGLAFDDPNYGEALTSIEGMTVDGRSWSWEGRNGRGFGFSTEPVAD